MKSPRSTRFFTALAASCLLVAITISAGAETFRFPSNKPIFSVALPAGWDCTLDKDGDASCQKGTDATYQIQIISADQIKNDASVKAVLEEVLQQVNAKTKMEDAAIGKPYEYKNVNDIKFTGQQSHGLVNGTEVYIISLVFAPQKGQYYVLQFIGGAKAPNEKVSSYVINSITPMKKAASDD